MMFIILLGAGSVFTARGAHCAIIRRVPWAVAPFVCSLSSELESIGLKLQCRLRRVGERAAN
jgi:hypothetical protein